MLPLTDLLPLVGLLYPTSGVAALTPEVELDRELRAPVLGLALVLGLGLVALEVQLRRHAHQLAST